MSLAGALNNAFSGLRANTRAAALVSSNIANATNENYGRRELQLSTNVTSTSGGVRVDGVLRHVNPILLNDLWVSDAELGFSNDLLEFSKTIEVALGSSDNAGSLAGRLTAFENALLSASSHPSSAERLETVAYTGNALAQKLNDLSSVVQAERKSADQSIAAKVDQLNTAISQLHKLNDDVLKARQVGANVESLLDERQRLIGTVSDIVPIRIIERDTGSISIFTQRGGTLLDGQPSVIGFSETLSIDVDKTLELGDLSGLFLNGTPINSTDQGMFAGGSLAAQFYVRDVAAVEQNALLDGLAQDLAERLGAGGPDTTLTAADAGFFTDTGIIYDPINLAGFAGRISINPDIRPGSDSTWKIRDGLGASAPGLSGDATLILGWADALTALSAPTSSSLGTVPANFVQHVSDLHTKVATTRVTREADVAFGHAQNTALKELQLSQGVDTDAELQRLMQIEQNFSANAQVLSVVDEMMERILAI